MRELKMKLRWIVLTTVDKEGETASHEAYVEKLQRVGCRISASALRKWLDVKTPFVPNARHLRAIHLIRPTVSTDWLLSVRTAQTVDETFLDTKVAESSR